ncbi:site-2 protease family protein [Streptomyces murinus]|nr:site-2 protease family protein [Streptomyces murinus]WUD06277.1 site-2 protease family protein [Streptomyces murinus]
MDVSGASGQPRSGDDQPTDHPAVPTPPPPAAEAPAPTEDGPDTDTAATGNPDSNTPGPQAARAEEPEDETPDTTGTTAPETETHETGADETGGDKVEADGAKAGRAGADEAGGDKVEADGAKADRAGADKAEADGAKTPEGVRDTAADTHATHRTLAHTEPPTGPAPGMAKGEPPRPPKEPGGGILMGRPFGVPVYVAPSWFLVAALITWVFGGQLDRVLPELGAARYLVSLFFAVAFYASVLVHELAHTVAAIRFKLPVRRIQLQFFGGVSEIEKEAETPGREFVLAFVGPLLSLVLAGLFYLAMKPVQPGTVPGVLLAGLMVSNLIVAAFNLLPGLPLDGGRMLRAVVWKITGKPMSGTVAAAWVGRALAVAVLVGLPLLNSSGGLGGGTGESGGMDTVTDALLAAILAAIIWTGAGNSLRMARLREHLPELRARTLTRRAVPVETDTPLSEALRRANAAGARALVVVDADGHPLSLVRESAIVGVPEHRRPWVPVSSLAQDLTDDMRVSAELSGEELLDALRAAPATEYLVVENTGEIYGVLSAADVERAFVKAMARPS